MVFFCMQKTAYEMRISDWSSDVCSSDLRLAWMAAKASAISVNELVLEPSAGTGMLGVWAAKAAARLALNEISPLRRECLGAVFPDATVTGFDGELIDELLTPDVGPSVVLMNPPYSHGIERGHDSRTGGRPFRSAWKRLLRSEEHTSEL